MRNYARMNGSDVLSILQAPCHTVIRIFINIEESVLRSGGIKGAYTVYTPTPHPTRERI